jgi:hypothetical protein
VRMCESCHFLKLPSSVETPLQTPSKTKKNSKKFSFHLLTTF